MNTGVKGGRHGEARGQRDGGRCCRGVRERKGGETCYRKLRMTLISKAKNLHFVSEALKMFLL